MPTDKQLRQQARKQAKANRKLSMKLRYSSRRTKVFIKRLSTAFTPIEVLESLRTLDAH